MPNSYGLNSAITQPNRPLMLLSIAIRSLLLSREGLGCSGDSWLDSLAPNMEARGEGIVNRFHGDGVMRQIAAAYVTFIWILWGSRPCRWIKMLGILGVVSVSNPMMCSTRFKWLLMTIDDYVSLDRILDALGCSRDAPELVNHRENEQNWNKGRGSMSLSWLMIRELILLWSKGDLMIGGLLIQGFSGMLWRTLTGVVRHWSQPNRKRNSWHE